MAENRKILIFAKYTQVPKDIWRWPNFTPREMACRGTSKLTLDFVFMDRLQALREAVGPLTVTSGYRSEEHDTAIGGAGVHPTGRAVDLLCHGRQTFRLLGLAGEYGFTGIGVSQAGKFGSRFLHLDDLGADETKGPRPWVWSY